jgi:CubicO group peptidase (beta-lactamase class C family)
LTHAGVEHLRAVAAEQVGETHISGLVVLVAHDTQVYAEAFGSLAVGGAPVARDSIFRISSTSKPIAAAATLAMVGEGLLELDESVERLLPELSERRVLRHALERAADGL